MIPLTQQGDKITFGTPEKRLVLIAKQMTPETINAAASHLLDAYPNEREVIERYAERLGRMT